MECCRIFQHVPFFRGICSDELTVLAEKNDVPAIGFGLNRVKQFLETHEGTEKGNRAVARLKEARKRGWLDEHLYLAMMVDGL